MGAVKVGERVQIDGRDGVFVVLRADAESGVADLLLTSGVRRILNEVPIASIHVLSNQAKLPGTEPA